MKKRLKRLLANLIWLMDNELKDQGKVVIKGSDARKFIDFK